MTNEQKYKTPEERKRAFRKFCASRECHKCECSKEGQEGILLCVFLWLTFEAEEEKPLTCPFCGADGIITEVKGGGFKVFCVECLSMSSAYLTKDKAIAAWNRRAK